MLMRTPETPSIVIVGGGSGGSRAARMLDHLSGVDMSVVVSVSDDGGSTGRIGQQFNTGPVGDLRRAEGSVAASPEIANYLEVRFGKDDDLDNVSTYLSGLELAVHKHTQGNDNARTKWLFDTSLDIAKQVDGGLNGHTLGNFVLTAAAIEENDTPFNEAIDFVSKVVGARAKIFPVTNERHTLYMQDGEDVIVGEHLIDTHTIKHQFIDASTGAFVYLNKNGRNVDALPAAADAIAQSDMTVISSGSPFTSLAPALLPRGISDALRLQKENDGLLVAFTNLENQPHDTFEWCVGRYALFLEKYGSRMPDKMFMNNSYEGLADPSKAVRYDQSIIDAYNIPVQQANLLSDEHPEYSKNDTIVRTATIHHLGQMVTLLREHGLAA